MKGKPIPRLMRTDPRCTRHLDNQSKLDGFCSELAEQFVQTCIVFMFGATQTRLAPTPDLGYILSMGVLSQIFCQMGGKCIFAHFKL